MVLSSLVLGVFCAPNPTMPLPHDNIHPTRTSPSERLRRRDSGLDLSLTPAPTGQIPGPRSTCSSDGAISIRS
ncbi:hypothetical protein BS47DRAFT_1339245 [Hydnum rufescens UP504]|uniref:Uncharacterized protein n=1 Tax=Hydnum rufescens UP504 TaxID=1448309 RepID=A0A9P6DXR1_9AGAM|nr:hypothetical protein BS47DRAFT_1339245 [Hydnum rufescens UP504]